jgi:DNA polymerase III subunit delta
MPEITYKELSTHLKKIKEPSGVNPPQAYLIHGEELLYKKAFDSIVDFLIQPADRIAGCEPVDGAPGSIRDAVNRANTFAMLPGNKIIAVQESRIFYGNQEKDKLLDKAKEAFQGEDFPKAAKYLLSLLGQHQLSLEDMTHQENLLTLLPGEAGETETKWFRDIIQYCIEQGLPVPSSDRPEQLLAEAIERGFPRGNYLVLTTDLVDKRRLLFKCFKDKGMVVDCSVPKGDRRADRLVQEEVLRNRMAAILESSKKNMAPGAFALLHEMTGFDLRTFSNNLEKLVLFTGVRSAITEDDVKAVLERSKQDPIYALTGAVSDRNPVQSLKLLDSLLQAGLHPLQVFTAIVNQFRKLILVKYFTRSPYGRGWHSAMPFNGFTTVVLPAMAAYDQALVDLLSEWDEMLSGDETEGSPMDEGGKPQKKKKRQKRKLPEDLLVAANPKNPYPIYLILKQADNFNMAELTDFYIRLSDTDIKLKRSTLNPKLVLEEIILRICRKQ